MYAVILERVFTSSVRSFTTSLVSCPQPPHEANHVCVRTEETIRYPSQNIVEWQRVSSSVLEVTKSGFLDCLQNGTSHWRFAWFTYKQQKGRYCKIGCKRQDKLSAVVRGPYLYAVSNHHIVEHGVFVIVLFSTLILVSHPNRRCCFLKF